MKKIRFKDKASYDSQSKTVISVRDGVLEYLAYELGIEDIDPNRVVRVKRTPATIANAAMKMANIPVTNEHVEVGVVVADSGGIVLSSEMVDVIGEGGATIAIKNSLDLNKDFIDLAKTKRELSLGYTAKIIPCDDGDCEFEQIDIIPHHLAIVDNGRCGDMCSFIDKKPTIEKVEDMKQKFKFKDASMEDIIEVIQGLPEAIQKVPVEMIEEVLPALKELIAASKELMTEETEEEAESTEETEESEKETEEATDEDAKEVDAEDEDKEEKGFGDSKKFADAVAAEVKARIKAIDKAKNFVDCDMTEMSTKDIMRKAVEAANADVKFTDAEIPVAFKLLKLVDNKAKEVDHDDKFSAFEDSRFNFIKGDAGSDKFTEWQNS